MEDRNCAAEGCAAEGANEIRESERDQREQTSSERANESEREQREPSRKYRERQKWEGETGETDSYYIRDHTRISTRFCDGSVGNTLYSFFFLFFSFEC